MVLQRDRTLPVWGWAKPGADITASLAGNSQISVSDERGAWRVDLPPLPSGGPFELAVTDGTELLRFEDILIGDVWVCSGQSNMEMNLRPGPEAVYHVEAEVAAAEYPQVRLLTIPPATGFEPQQDIRSKGWQVCSPETVIPFSAAGYFFGRELYRHLDIPIGLINCSKGASPAEAWTRADALRALPTFQPVIDEMPARIAESRRLLPEYERQLAEWGSYLETQDAGQKKGAPVWAEPEQDDSSWDTMQVPDYWENGGYPDFDGVMWFRKEIDLTLDWVGRPLELGVCTVNDMDRTYFNGVEVGRFEKTAGWTAPRLYEVPSDLVKPGRNVIVVRVYDVGNKGGICGASDDLWLRTKDEPYSALSLAGTWRLAPGLDLRSLPAKPAPPPFLEGNHRAPAALWNGMVAPLIPFGIKGVIWYQGESNASRPEEYADLFATLIRDWRAQWGQGDFPFLFVQLASIGPINSEPSDDKMSRLREAQFKTLALPNTAMAVTIDIGDPILGHPRNKQDVGIRLAYAARQVAYGEKIVGWGPLYQSHSLEGGTIRVRFGSTGEGLKTRDGAPLVGFAVAGEDRMFSWAEAQIDGETVSAGSPKVPHPVAIRYAWSTNPPANLTNAEGFPASPFRTDDWPLEEDSPP